MAETHMRPKENRLLALLPENEYSAVVAHLEPCDTPRGFIIVEAGATIEHAYFPCSGIGSVINISPEGNRVEAGLFGRDGFAPTAAAIEAPVSILEVAVQVPGSAYRLPQSRLLDLMQTQPMFANLLHKSLHVLAIQAGFTALSNAVHAIDERLARWILMCHDRIDGNELALTHDFIALMLAVRRPSVTTALHVLEGNRFIRSVRGLVIVRDRAGLEDFASDAYGKAEEEYERLIGPLRKSTR
ncbi:Crp family transcriptional regulator protein (plasmid) [Rhizobium sp. N6212]|nr:Crp family transcriptional regulator protein [Rhizobium sp. N6212]ANL00996.1 Crp family transcriptional regulator protein [Rhizobium sp. N621]ANL07117.1 Crp family transcriptional regulator protein [Rhizobium esperanzae]ANL13287.1 Crp family transcriptional regulator protein [Rhizobium sp. N1341]ANL25268.1 Crp family transcriptional regulator protein [Rhizobium sp. N113]ANM37959.1 Crp family transcriptional regulator protein [Rhizobium sp. N871]ANM44111.1 Crp family transcriptional regulat